MACLLHALMLLRMFALLLRRPWLGCSVLGWVTVEQRWCWLQ